MTEVTYNSVQLKQHLARAGTATTDRQKKNKKKKSEKYPEATGSQNTAQS